MKRKDILDALNGIDFDMVEDAEGKHHASGGALWLRWVAVAACICLVIAAIVALPIALRYGRERWLEIPDDSTVEQTDISPDGSDLTSDTDDTALSPGANGTGSADSEEPDSPSGEYVSSYELKTVGDQLYMVFDSYNVPPNDEDDLTDGSYGVTFDSVEDFQRGVINDKSYGAGVYEGNGFRTLTLDEMEKIVSTFTRDDIGVPIVDMYNLYLPDMPDGWELGWGDGYPVIDWRDGDDYVVYVSNSTENKRATFRMLSQTNYESALDGWTQSNGEPTHIEADGKDIYVFDHASSSGKHTVTTYTVDSVFSTSYYYSYSLIDETSAPSDEYCLGFEGKKQYISDYNIEKVGDQWYMICDSYRLRPSNDDIMILDVGINFKSLSDMKYTALNRGFSINELENILRLWRRDEVGVLIVDLDNLHVPDMPDGWTLFDGIEWHGDVYYYAAHNGEKRVQVGVKNDVGRNNTVLERTIQSEGKVVEIYTNRWQSEYDMKVIDGERVYVLELRGINRFTDEELLSIGLGRAQERDYYYGTYKDGQLEMKHTKYGISRVAINVKEFTILGPSEEDDCTNNKLVLELSSYIPQKYHISYTSGYSDDHFIDMNSLYADLSSESQTVEIEYLGSLRWNYEVLIYCDSTIVCIRVYL